MEEAREREREMKSQFSYRMDYHPPAKGIFVTQIGGTTGHLYGEEREPPCPPTAATADNHLGADVIHCPVGTVAVVGAGESVLRNGVNTKQKTLLIREHMLVDKMTSELKEKRELFEQRMQVINARKDAFRDKQESLRLKVANDQKYIVEQNAKRERAVEKFKSERKTNERLAVQQSQLSEELAQLKSRNRQLRQHIAQHSPYNHFMNNVIDNLPDKFIDAPDNKVAALMMRHGTLEETNRDLVTRMGFLSDEVKNEQKRLEALNAKHNEEQLASMMDVKRARERLEKLKDRNQDKQQQLFFAKNRFRHESQQWGQTLLSMRNLADRCRFNFRTNKPIAMPIEDQNDFNAMLYRIEQYVGDHKDIVSWTKDAASNPSSNKTSII